MALRCKRRCEIYVLLGAGSLTTVFLGVGPIPEEAWKWAGPAHQSWTPMTILSDPLGRLERFGADVAE